MEKFLREVLNNDRTLLKSKETLLERLKEKVPSRILLEVPEVEQAINLEVGKFFVADITERNVAKVSAVNFLIQSGMTQSQAEKVANIFSEALEWDKGYFRADSGKVNLVKIKPESVQNIPEPETVQPVYQQPIQETQPMQPVYRQQNYNSPPPPNYQPQNNYQPASQQNNESNTKFLLVIITVLAVALGFVLGGQLGDSDDNKKNSLPIVDETEKISDTEKTPASLPPVQEQKASVEPVGPHWIQDTNNGIYLWNPEPTDGESIAWSGGYIQDGPYKFADGRGTITWRRYGKTIQVDEGGFSHGRHHGQFKHQFFPSGRIEYSNWDHGTEIPVN